MKRIVASSNEKKYCVRWLEVKVVSTDVYANSPEVAIGKKPLWRILENEKTEYSISVYPNSSECVDVGSEIREVEDLNRYLARVVKQNRVKKIPSSL